MPLHFKPHGKKKTAPSLKNLHRPLKEILPNAPVLESRGDRPLQMDFEEQLDALILFHLKEHKSGRELLQFKVFYRVELFRDCLLHIIPPNNIEAEECTT